MERLHFNFSIPCNSNRFLSASNSTLLLSIGHSVKNPSQSETHFCLVSSRTAYLCGFACTPDQAYPYSESHVHTTRQPGQLSNFKYGDPRLPSLKRPPHRSSASQDERQCQALSLEHAPKQEDQSPENRKRSSVRRSCVSISARARAFRLRNSPGTSH